MKTKDEKNKEGLKDIIIVSFSVLTTSIFMSLAFYLERTGEEFKAIILLFSIIIYFLAVICFQNLGDRK